MQRKLGLSVSVLLISLLSVPVQALAANSTTSQKVHTRVIGGSQALNGALPFVARLESSVDSRGQSVAPGTPGFRWAGFCTASLITPQWVLTAAHCVQPYQATGRIGRLRVSFLNQAEDGGVGSSSIRIDRGLAHPGYSSWIFSQYAPQDVALLHLVSPSSVAPVQIAASRNADRSNRNRGVIAGYGVSQPGSSSMNSSLRSGTLQLGSDAYCGSRDAVADERINPSFQLCRTVTDSLQGEEGISCSGDSGGPVLVKDQSPEGKVMLVGVVSWGAAADNSCWSPGAYDVYARVGAVADWISRNSGSNLTGNSAFNMSRQTAGLRIAALVPLPGGRVRMRLMVGGSGAKINVWIARYSYRSRMYRLANQNTAPRTIQSLAARGKDFVLSAASGAWGGSRQCVVMVLQTQNQLGNYSSRGVASFTTYRKGRQVLLRRGACPQSGLFAY